MEFFLAEWHVASVNRALNFTDMQTQIKEVMIHKQNPLTGDWLCYIPKTSQAYYCKTKKQAKSFCDKVNNAFSTGELFFDKNRKLQINQP